MSRIEIIEKPLPAIRLAARSAVVAEQPEVPGVVGPLFDSVAAILVPAGVPGGVPVAEYDMGEDGLRITAGFAHSGPVPDGAEAVDLPAVPAAVCGVHLGSMEHIGESWQAVHAEIIARGFTLSGPCREVYLRSESTDQADWVTELQQPVARA